MNVLSGYRTPARPVQRAAGTRPRPLRRDRDPRQVSTALARGNGMAPGVGRPRRRARACTACVPLLVLYTAMCVGADKAKDMYIEDTDRFPGWKGELPRTAEEDGPNTIGYGEGGVVSSPGCTEHDR